MLDLLGTRRGWRVAVACTALGALAVRLLIIARSHGGADLRIYTYFARLALHGANPFAPPPGGEFPSLESDNPPVEIAAFAGLLALHDSPTTLRVLFALSDVALVLLVALWFPRPRRWRLAFAAFYAFNPFVLFAWTAFAEDKTLVFLGLALWLLALERGREWLSWAMAIALTALKFAGAFAAPVLAVESFRRRQWRAMVPIAAFALGLLLSYLPWFPHSVDTLTRRDARLQTNPPIHASPTILLARLGVYAPVEAKVLTAVALFAVLTLFLARRLAVREAVVWSLFCGFVFLPNNSFNRVLVITLPFLLIVDMSAVRWLAVWAASSAAALAGVVATRGVPHALAPVGGALRALFSHESTVRHVLWMNLLTVLVLAFYFADRRRRERPAPVAVVSARANASAIAS